MSEEASIPIWGPVALVAAGSGEYIARAGPTTNEGDPHVIGIAVGPLRDAENGYVSDAAGQAIQVLTFGKGKCKVDGQENIAVGDALNSHAADGIAQLLGAIDGTDWASVTVQAQLAASGFAIALYASTVDLGIIPVHVHGARGTLA